MTDPVLPKTPTNKDREKAERLAEQLRANLRRRKEQAREMQWKD